MPVKYYFKQILSKYGLDYELNSHKLGLKKKTSHLIIEERKITLGLDISSNARACSSKREVQPDMLLIIKVANLTMHLLDKNGKNKGFAEIQRENANMLDTST